MAHSPAADRLKAAGLRVTAPRVSVLDVLEDLPHHDAESIAAVVRQRLGTVSTQAVYDVLHALTSAGLLRRIEPAGSPARYETRVGDNHHHVVCRRCGTMADVDCEKDVVPCLLPTADHGFEIDEAEITFWGMCPTCRAATNEERQ
jgi:Fur family transcriptional regulator, stress-responsive regulator